MLDKITTEELEKELEKRKAYAQKDDGFPHIFLYSKTNNEFDTELMPVPSPADLQLMPMMLRCRYNAQRDLRIFSIKLSAEDGRRLNEVIKDPSEHQRIFELIEKALVEFPI